MGARILIIEDNPTNLELMSYLLRAYGHQIETAYGGAEGFELAQQGVPDLIACDVQMPGGSGYDVARWLKGVPQTADIPLVAVTALAMVDDRRKVLEGGFHGYISKPINPETFVAEIEAFLPEGLRSDGRPSPPGAAAAGSTRARPVLRPNSEAPPPIILVVDDSPTNRDFAQALFVGSGFQVDLADGVQAALDRARACKPDLILSDLHLRGRGGFELIRAVKADAGLREIPFMFLSATIYPEADRVTALSLGATGLLARPLEPQRLLDEVAACLAIF